MLKNINVNKENVKEVIENAVDWIYEDIDNFIINGESSTKEATAKIKRAYEITKHKRTPIPIFMG